MPIKIIEYENPQTKKSNTAIDVQSIIEYMNEIEIAYGTTEKVIHEQWYTLKRQLAETLSPPKNQDKGATTEKKDDAETTTN